MPFHQNKSMGLGQCNTVMWSPTSFQGVSVPNSDFCFGDRLWCTFVIPKQKLTAPCLDTKKLTASCPDTNFRLDLRSGKVLRGQALAFDLKWPRKPGMALVGCRGHCVYDEARCSYIIFSLTNASSFYAFWYFHFVGNSLRVSCCSSG